MALSPTVQHRHRSHSAPPIRERNREMPLQLSTDHRRVTDAGRRGIRNAEHTSNPHGFSEREVYQLPPSSYRMSPTSDLDYDSGYDSGYDSDEFEGYVPPRGRSVDAMRVTHPVPRAPVGELDTYYGLEDKEDLDPRHSLFDPSGRPSDVTLQIVKQPPEVELEITKVPRKKVALYNAYHDGSGNVKGHYFDLKAKHHDILQETFYDIKQHCLESGQMPGNATGFTVNWSKREVRFYDPAIGHTRLLDLDKMMKTNPDINDKVVAAEELISTKINKGAIRNHKIAPNNKGSSDGAAPLYRSNQVLDSLPKSTGDQAYKTAMTLASNVLTDEPQKDAAIHRMGKAETIIKKTKDKVAQEKATLVPLWTAEGDPARRAQLQKSIEELTALEQRLNSIDTFALYSALAFYPQDADPRPEDVYQRAQMLQKQSADMLEQARKQAVEDGTKRSWYPGWAPFSNAVRGEPKIDESRFYPADVGGLVFSGLEFPEARSGYVDFCRANNVYCKGDGLEDALLREVLRPGSTASGDNPVLERLFDDITDPTLKGNLQAETTGAITSVRTAPVVPLTAADPSARVDEYRTAAALV